MTLVMIGAFLVFAGVVFMAWQPLWQGPLSNVRRRGNGLGSQGASDTLEPQKPAKGFGIKSNWPGLAMVATGAGLLLAVAAL